MKLVTFIMIIVFLCQDVVLALQPESIFADGSKRASEVVQADGMGKAREKRKGPSCRKGRRTANAGDNEPTQRDFQEMAGGFLKSQTMPPEEFLRLYRKDPDEEFTFVIASQREIVNRRQVMDDTLTYREFLDSEAAKELLRIHSSLPEFLWAEALSKWLVRYGRELAPIYDILQRSTGTPAEVLADFPPDVIEEYYRDKRKYPDLNILPAKALRYLKYIGVSFLPDEHVREDIADIIKKLRSKGISVMPVLTRSRLFKWPRDIIGWIDEEHYIDSRLKGESSMTEGGNIVSGNGRAGKFILVSSGVRGESIEWLRGKTPSTSIVTIRPGFSTLRHNGTLYHIPHGHIDMVVGFVPGYLTKDGKGKLLIDPQYFRYEGEKLNILAKEQDIDIVFVDEDELQLQMPNFSIVDGYIIINKGEKTIKALNLKEGVVIFPRNPNTEDVFSDGSYRCRTNLLPKDIAEQLIPIDEDAEDHEENDPNVTCGTICESGHEGSYDALDKQLERQFEELREILQKFEIRNPKSETEDLKEGEADRALVEYTKKFGIDITEKQIKEYREQIRGSIEGLQEIKIFFSIPETGTQLFWVGNDYAGGHFNKAGTRIHISLPIILNRGIEAGIAIAEHELRHIRGRGHQDDRGMKIVRRVADFKGKPYKDAVFAQKLYEENYVVGSGKDNKYIQPTITLIRLWEEAQARLLKSVFVKGYLVRLAKFGETWELESINDARTKAEEKYNFGVFVSHEGKTEIPIPEKGHDVQPAGDIAADRKQWPAVVLNKPGLPPHLAAGADEMEKVAQRERRQGRGVVEDKSRPQWLAGIDDLDKERALALAFLSKNNWNFESLQEYFEDHFNYSRARVALADFIREMKLVEEFQKKYNKVYIEKQGVMYKVAEYFGITWTLLIKIKQSLGIVDPQATFERTAVRAEYVYQPIDYSSIRKEDALRKLEEVKWNLVKFHDYCAGIFNRGRIPLPDLLRGLNLAAEFKSKYEKVYKENIGIVHLVADYFGIVSVTLRNLTEDLEIDDPEETEVSRGLLLNVVKRTKGDVLKLLEDFNWNLGRLISELRLGRLRVLSVIKGLDIEEEFKIRFRELYRLKQGRDDKIAECFGVHKVTLQGILEVINIDISDIELFDDGVILEGYGLKKETVLAELQSEEVNWNLPLFRERLAERGIVAIKVKYSNMIKGLGITKEFLDKFDKVFIENGKSLAVAARLFGLRDRSIKELLIGLGRKEYEEAGLEKFKEGELLKITSITKDDLLKIIADKKWNLPDIIEYFKQKGWLKKNIWYMDLITGLDIVEEFKEEVVRVFKENRGLKKAVWVYFGINCHTLNTLIEDLNIDLDILETPEQKQFNEIVYLYAKELQQGTATPEIYEKLKLLLNKFTGWDAEAEEYRIKTKFRGSNVLVIIVPEDKLYRVLFEWQDEKGLRVVLKGEGEADEEAILYEIDNCKTFEEGGEYKTIYAHMLGRKKNAPKDMINSIIARYSELIHADKKLAEVKYPRPDTSGRGILLREELSAQATPVRDALSFPQQAAEYSRAVIKNEILELINACQYAEVDIDIKSYVITPVSGSYKNVVFYHLPEGKLYMKLQWDDLVGLVAVFGRGKDPKPEDIVYDLMPYAQSDGLATKENTKNIYAKKIGEGDELNHARMNKVIVKYVNLLRAGKPTDEVKKEMEEDIQLFGTWKKTTTAGFTTTPYTNNQLAYQHLPAGDYYISFEWLTGTGLVLAFLEVGKDKIDTVFCDINAYKAYNPNAAELNVISVHRLGSRVQIRSDLLLGSLEKLILKYAEYLNQNRTLEDIHDLLKEEISAFGVRDVSLKANSFSITPVKKNTLLFLGLASCEYMLSLGWHGEYGLLVYMVPKDETQKTQIYNVSPYRDYDPAGQERNQLCASIVTSKINPPPKKEVVVKEKTVRQRPPKSQREEEGVSVVSDHKLPAEKLPVLREKQDPRVIKKGALAKLGELDCEIFNNPVLAINSKIYLKFGDGKIKEYVIGDILDTLLVFVNRKKEWLSIREWLDVTEEAVAEPRVTKPETDELEAPAGISAESKYPKIPRLTKLKDPQTGKIYTLLGPRHEGSEEVLMSPENILNLKPDRGGEIFKISVSDAGEKGWLILFSEDDPDDPSSWATFAEYTAFENVTCGAEKAEEFKDRTGVLSSV